MIDHVTSFIVLQYTSDAFFCLTSNIVLSSVHVKPFCAQTYLIIYRIKSFSDMSWIGSCWEIETSQYFWSTWNHLRNIIDDKGRCMYL